MTTVAAEPTKLEVLQQREAEYAIEVDAVRTRLAAYPAEQAAEREETIFAGKKPLGTLNTRLQKLLDAEAKDARALIHAEGNLAACRAVLAEEAARVAAQATAQARKEQARLLEREEAIWKRASDLFAELAVCWGEYVESAEEQDRLARSNGLDGSGVLAVEPAPASFETFVKLLVAASIDPQGQGYREGPLNGGLRLDDRQVLVRLVPDLRAHVRRAEFSGSIPRREA